MSDTDPKLGADNEPDGDTGTAEVAPDQASAVEAPAAGTAGRPRGRRRWAGWVIGAVGVAVIVGLLAWYGRAPLTGGPAASSTSPTAASLPALDAAQLIVAGDLTKLRKNTKWTESALSSATPSGPAPGGGPETMSGPAIPSQAAPSGSAGPSTAATPAAATPANPSDFANQREPECVAPAAGAAAVGEQRRLFTSTAAGIDLLQLVRAWPDAGAATAAHDALLAEVAACRGGTIRAAHRIDALADTATAFAVTASGGRWHTLLIARTGRFVWLLDGGAAAGAGLDPAALATASVPSAGRLCHPAAGACPGSPKTLAVAPPATATAGWLALVDLPRISAEAGAWTATDPQQPRIVGSQCEDVDLNRLPTSKSSAHRTYLLTSDPKAPPGFGIDEAIYTFDKPSDATAAAKRLRESFSGCAKRTRTGSVKTADLVTPDGTGAELRANSYLVSQRVSDSRTVTFRVGVGVAGARLVYLLANPADGFDFSEAAWRGIVGRATQRVTQLP